VTEKRITPANYPEGKGSRRKKIKRRKIEIQKER